MQPSACHRVARSLQRSAASACPLGPRIGFAPTPSHRIGYRVRLRRVPSTDLSCSGVSCYESCRCCARLASSCPSLLVPAGASNSCGPIRIVAADTFLSQTCGALLRCSMPSASLPHNPAPRGGVFFSWLGHNILCPAFAGVLLEPHNIL